MTLSNNINQTTEKTDYVYVLKSLKDGKRYIGMTSDFERRIAEHNSGKVKSTKNRKPIVLLYKEEYDNKTTAMQRENFLKQVGQ